MGPGVVLGERFELAERVGAGGMGVVHRAIDRTTGKSVAIKILRSDQDQARFAREIELLAHIDEPGIVRYVAHGTSHEDHWLAMEWLEGEELAARLKRGKLTLAECVSVGTQVAQTLSRLHGRGVVHRDLKPSNLYLVERDIERVKLLDLGIAHLRGAVVSLTNTGDRVGTPAYMSPEQARGDADVDARADIYSLGCVLYECASGAPAFRGPNVVAILTKVLFEPVPSLDEREPRIDPAFSDLVGAMMRRSPARRPSLREVVHTFGSLTDGTLPAETRREKPRRATLTSRERELAAVLLVAPPSAPSPEFAQMIRQVADEHGASTALFPDGSCALMWRSERTWGERAIRACRAALRVQRLGDAPGLAFALGRASESDSLPMGDVIDRAAELLAASPGRGLVCLDEASLGLVPSTFVVDERDGQHVLVEEHAHAPVRTLLGRPTPFVGRADEIAMLHRLFERCVAEPAATLALVTGEAGVGKSRLRHELVQELDADATVFIGRGDPMRSGSPFWHVIDALRGALGLRECHLAPLQREQLRSAIATLVDESARPRVEEFLGELLSIPAEDAPSQQLRAARGDPMLLGDQIRRACLDVIAAHCARRPLVLVLEDLHWGDAASLGLVDHLRRNLRHSAFFVLALARPEVHDAFPNMILRPGDHELRLGRLGPRASAALVRSALGDASETTIERIAGHADGHAFFLEELIRAELRAPGDPSPPPTVLSMLEARMQAVDKSLRQVLRAASVFGRTFWTAGVARLVPFDVGSLSAALHALVEEELVVPSVPSQIAGQEQYVFRHALVRDVAYDALTDEDRTLGHRLAGAWLEQIGHSDALALSEHFERGGEPARAAAHLVRAAEEALEGNDLPAAMTRTERALGLELGRDLRLRALVAQANAALWMAKVDVRDHAAREALELASPPEPAWFAMHSLYVSGRIERGEHAEAERLGEALCEVAERSPASDPLARALVREARLLLTRSPATAQRMLSAYERHIEGRIPGSPWTMAFLWGVRGFELGVKGDLAGLITHQRHAVACMTEAGDLRHRTYALTSCGSALASVGEYAEAERLIRNALADAERLGIDRALAPVRLNLGAILSRKGRLEDAERELAAAQDGVDAQGDYRLCAAVRIELARVYLASGRVDDAMRVALDADEHARRAAPQLLALTEATIASVLLARGEAAQALELASRALSALGDDPPIEAGEAFARLVHVDALRANGETDRARTAIRLAAQRIHDRARPFSVPELRASFLANVPEHARTLAESEG